MTRQHAVKRVTMNGWKRGELAYTGLIEGQAGNLVPFTLGREIVLWGLRQRQLAKVVSNNRFPEGRPTQIDIIPRVTNVFSPATSQPRVPTDEPKENVRIE